MPIDDDKSKNISIHSLVKRETPDGRACRTSRKDFNPLPRKEGDAKSTRCSCQAFYFNPLPRKEGDLWSGRAWAAWFDFNPLPRKEGDRAGMPLITLNGSISIHSLVKRETGSEMLRSPC